MTVLCASCEWAAIRVEDLTYVNQRKCPHIEFKEGESVSFSLENCNDWLLIGSPIPKQEEPEEVQIETPKCPECGKEMWSYAGGWMCPCGGYRP